MAVTKTRAGTYKVRMRGPDGREVTKTFATKALAQQWERNSRTDVDRGTFVKIQPGRTTVGEWAQVWLAGLVRPTASTRYRYQGILRTHILPRWGSRRLDSVGHGEAQTWVAELVEAGQSPASIHKIVGVLSRVLALAVKDNRLAVNPIPGVELPRVGRSRHRYLTHAQVDDLADALPSERDALAVLVLAYCGLQMG